jgi:hypothetical protein
VNVYAVAIFAIDVAATVLTFVYHQTFFAAQTGLMCKCGAKQSGTHNQIIILF